MRRIFEKALSIGLGLLIISVVITLGAFVFGGSAIGLLTLIIGFPLAFPLTTTFIVIALALLFWRQKKQPDQ